MVRVRFAPSPTGFLHVGNVRAALMNFLFSIKEKGDFILRLDDTDFERSKEEYVQGILKDLAWLGIQYVETFKQSDRMDRYAQAAEYLKEKGRLYPCYETPEELEFMRKRLIARGLPPIYDRAALKLTDSEKEQLHAQGRKPHWRFKMDESVIQWNDLVRGHAEFHGKNITDPVLIREDGVPLYTLPSVVDDMDYDITHIIRGEDHVTNTASQIQIIEALKDFPGIKTTKIEFAHLALLTNADGGGFSKREGSLSIQDLRENGIEAISILAYLAKLGTSDPIEPKHHLEDLAKDFSFHKFSRSAARFDAEELIHFNAKILHNMPFECALNKIQEFDLPIDEQFWLTIRGNLNKMEDLKLWWNLCHAPVQPEITDKDYIEQAINCLPSSWDETTWSTWTNQLKQDTGRKGKELFMPLRLAITGMPHGPEMQRLLPLLPKDVVLKRLKGETA